MSLAQMIELRELLPKYPGYFARNDGQIISMKRPLVPLVLQQQLDRRGYHYVSLSIAGKVTRVSVHRLIAYAFNGLVLEDRKSQVNHDDGNKSNNTPGNFVITDNSGNHLHAYRVLGRARPIGRKGADHVHAGRYRITRPDGVIELIHGLNAYCSANGLRQSNMSNVLAGKAKHHQGYKIERITR